METYSEAWYSLPELKPMPLDVATSIYVPNNIRVADVSKHQRILGTTEGRPIDFQKMAAMGVKGVAIRCTVGDYYTDPYFAESWENAGIAGLVRTAYHVVAPADSAGRQSSWSAQFDLFTGAFGYRKPDLPLILDCELSRGQSPSYISQMIQFAVDDFYFMDNRYPMIYTRQSWWDMYVLQHDWIKDCPLMIARYADLPGPWSDGRYKPRDWNTWMLWQYTDREDGIAHGCTSYQVDMSIFNGTEADWLAFIGKQPQPPTLDDRVAALEADMALVKGKLSL